MINLFIPILALVIVLLFQIKNNVRENFEEAKTPTPQMISVSLSQFNSLKEQVINQNKRLKKVESKMKRVDGMMKGMEE